METEKYTVTFGASDKMFEVRNSANEIVERRVTPGATLAELIDRGMSREDASAQVLKADTLRW